MYEKIIEVGALPNSTVKTINHGIINLDMFVSIRGIAKDTSSGTQFPLPFTSVTGLTNQISLAGYVSTIRIETGLNRSSYNKTYLILQYTKTTD